MLPVKKPGKKGKTGLCYLKARAQAEPGLLWEMGEGGYCQWRQNVVLGFLESRSMSSDGGNEASFISLS